MPTRRAWFTTALAGTLTSCTQKTAQQEDPGFLGKPVSGYGERSPFETAKRGLTDTRYPESTRSVTPLQDSCGMITPSSLHFERHHSGVPKIDPAQHKLMIHGLVDRPLIFTMQELRRLPSVSKIYFLECSGNSRSEWSGAGGSNAGTSHGLASCSEWTGIPLSLLLAEVGVQKSAKWLLAEGADANHMQRSLPIEKALADTLVVWGQNGEALRPEQGYPLRLVVPGWEGNTSVKWLRRIEAAEEPFMVRDETAKYTDLLADGKARQFTFVMEAKSVITSPSGGQKIGGPGFFEISGLAWSGRGRIEKVEVSVDGGKSWREAALQEPRLPLAFTRFRLPWQWDGSETLIQSRCTDESGYVQPAREALLEARGTQSDYHCNAIKTWKVGTDGKVTNA